MTAILSWSNGIELNTRIFYDLDGKSGYERAQKQMLKEYDEHGDPEDDSGAYRGDDSCLFAADGVDSCIWDITTLLEEKKTVTVQVICFSTGNEHEHKMLRVDSFTAFSEEKAFELAEKFMQEDMDRVSDEEEASLNENGCDSVSSRNYGDGTGYVNVDHDKFCFNWEIKIMND